MKRYKADSQAKCNQILVKIVNNNEEISEVYCKQLSHLFFQYWKRAG